MNTDLSTFTFLGLGLAGWLVIFIINCFVVAFWDGFGIIPLQQEWIKQMKF